MRARIFSFGLILVVCATANGGNPPPPPPGPCCWPPIPTANGAVNWWHFDEPSGTTSADVAGMTNNIGVDHGVIPRVGGIKARAIELQGTQWVQVANAGEVDFAGNCPNNNAESGTIAFWIATSSTSPIPGVVTILDKRTMLSGYKGYSVFLYNGKLGFQMATGPGIKFVATTLPTIANGNWHFVAVSFSRCNAPTGFLYVDGSTQTFAPSVGDMTNAGDLYIGRSSFGGGYFKGWIDELMIFKYAHPKTSLDALKADHCYANCWF